MKGVDEHDFGAGSSADYGEDIFRRILMNILMSNDPFGRILIAQAKMEI